MSDDEGSSDDSIQIQPSPARHHKADQEPRRISSSSISSKTWMPVGAVVFIVGIVISATAWCVTVTARLSSIETAVKASNDSKVDRWRLVAWTKTLKIMNPTMQVPDLIVSDE